MLSPTLVHHIQHDQTLTAILLNGPWLAYGGEGLHVHVVHFDWMSNNMLLIAMYARFPEVLGLKLLYPHLLIIYNFEVKQFSLSLAPLIQLVILCDLQSAQKYISTI